MKANRAIVAAALAAWTCSAAAQHIGLPRPAAPFDGHKWVHVKPRTLAELRTALAMSVQTLDCAPPGDETTTAHAAFNVQMTPAQYAAFAQAGIPHDVWYDDLQAAIDAERARIEIRRANPALAGGVGDGGTWYEEFKTYSEVRQHALDLAAAFPTLAKYEVIGQTLQGRDIFALRVTGPGSPAGRAAILFDGTQHAREWVSPMCTIYIAEQLLEQYATNANVKSLVDGLEFLIVPIVNADGYEYAWLNTSTRMWRKNRRPPPTGSACYGVDTNRNWGYQWGSNNGSSGDPCNETFRGLTAFSEVESQVVRDYVLANPRLKATIDFHSFSQLILEPWGYTNALPPAHATFQQISAQMAAAINGVHGFTYVYGPGYTTIYPTSGGIKDWMYGARNLLAWTIELRDTGTYGFILPPEQIIPNCEENFAAVLALANAVAPKLLFALPQGAPIHAVAGGTTPVVVEIKPGVQTMQAGTGRLFYRFGTSGPATAVVLTSLGSNLYQGLLPGGDCGQPVQFVFQATTTVGSVLKYPELGFADAFEATAYDTVTAFSDSCETQTGWAVGGPGSNATAGTWVRNDPQATAAQPENDHTPGTGVYCYVTGHLAGQSAAQYDVDGGSTILTTPVVSGLSPQPMEAPQVWLSYWRWYSNDKGLNPNSDTMLVQISNNAGVSWTTVEEISQSSNAWVRKEFKVSDVVTPTSLMRARFIAADLAADSIVEALIDDVEIRIVGCPGTATCYPDCNNDGALTVSDFGCFQTKFVAQEAYADCNEDQQLTVSDFGCFQTKFVAGCP